MLIATDSDATRLHVQAGAAGLDRHLRVLPLRGVAGADDERLRVEVHAVADIVIVPRASSGGLPIKLLDALSRGKPTVAVPAALAGVDYADALVVAPGDDGAALAAAIVETLSSPQRMVRLIEHARQHIETHHSTEAFLSALDACCDAALL